MSRLANGAAVGPEGVELEWSDLMVILAVCRAGSLSGAARVLGHNHSTIFRKINAIEEKTRVRFFERLPDGYAMTEAGEIALRYAERIEAEVHALGREVLGQDMRLQGKVRLTAPEGMATKTLPKLVAEFCRHNPDVSIDIVGGSSAVDLSRREADIAIRATRKPPDTSLGKMVTDGFCFAAYAAPRYLKRKKSRSLQEHDWCLIQGTVDWLVPLVWKKKAHGEQRTVFTSSSALTVMNATAEGMGLTFMPCYLGDDDKRLVRVSNIAEPLTLELWLLTHADLRHTARVKALMAFLYDAISKDKELYEGKRMREMSDTRFKI